MNAFLILEDGTKFSGTHIGAERESVSEIVFNTQMTGYLEVLTDPSYAGQSVVMTYPLIGNYGVTPDMESACLWPRGFIVRELSRSASNFRCRGDLEDLLVKSGIPGVAGIDTRQLTKILREKGTMNGLITTMDYTDEQLRGLLPKIAAYRVHGELANVTCAEKYVVTRNSIPEDALFSYDTLHRNDHLFWGDAADAGTLPGEGLRVALLDFGCKDNIIRSLANRGCEVTVWPAYSKAEDVLADRPDGIMLSNGPGDPKEYQEVIAEVRRLYEADIPVFAICLGHQLMALAAGADTHKLKYGHRGGNHPVRDLATGKCYITSQNHGYVVDPSGMDGSLARPSFENVNDGTNEGMIYPGKNIYTVQFHPEASGGPLDTGFLFDRFIRVMKGGESFA